MYCLKLVVLRNQDQKTYQKDGLSKIYQKKSATLII